MFIEMTCSCTATFQIEAEEDNTLAMLWAHQFVNAHQGCGFMLPPVTDVEEKTKRYDITYREEREKEL